MTIDYRALIERSRCLLCVTQHDLEVIAVRILADLLLAKDPMADVSIQSMLSRSRQLIALTNHELLAIIVDLLTNVAVSVDNVIVNGAAELDDVAYYDGKMAYLLYFETPGDRSGGHFYYNELSFAVPGTDVILPAGKTLLDAGRWLRSPNPT